MVAGEPDAFMSAGRKAFLDAAARALLAAPESSLPDELVSGVLDWVADLVERGIIRVLDIAFVRCDVRDPASVDEAVIAARENTRSRPVCTLVAAMNNGIPLSRTASKSTKRRSTIRTPASRAMARASKEAPLASSEGKAR